MRDFYERFYALAPHSAAHGEFCRRVFGKNLCQHGFADMEQLQAVMDATHLRPKMTLLDVGCGVGMIAEYLSDSTGARVWGVDFIPQAIEQARARTEDKADRLAFEVADVNALELPQGVFDVVLSIDTLYFSADYIATLRALMGALRPGGQMALFYAHGRLPGVAPAAFPMETLHPQRTPLGEALVALDLPFTVRDFTEADERLARRRRDVLEDLHEQFVEEGLDFVYENRLGDANGIRLAAADGQHRRYLYHVRLR